MTRHSQPVARCQVQRRSVAAWRSLLAACGAYFAILAPFRSPALAAEGPPPLTAETSRQEYTQAVGPYFARHCHECHGAKDPEKNLELALLDPDMKQSTSAARWATVLKQLSTGAMPPKDKPRPKDDETARVTAWIAAEMKRSGKHLASRASYDNGNALSHALLFGTAPAATVDSPTGARRLSAEIYSAFGKDFLKDGKLGQPFSPVGRTTFKDMGSPKIDEPTTSQLIDNALLLVDQRLAAHKLEDGVVKSVGSSPKEVLRLFDEQNPATRKDIEAALQTTFELALRRRPTPDELERFVALYEKNLREAGRVTGARFTLAAVFLLPEAVYRMELGAGEPDSQGRVRLTPREIAFALSYALTDRRPDAAWLAAAENGDLDTQAGVAKSVRAMLDDSKLEKPRLLRFFREYFGYDKAVDVFKDPEEKREHHPHELVADTDRLVLYILEQDKQVLKELLTTNKSFVNFRYDANKQEGVQARKDAIHLAYNLPLDWKWTADQPIELPAHQRAGILTQPSWLVGWSKSDDNDAIRRGKWVRERLLGNVVPDVPITVDAQLPIAPEKSLRERMAVTQEQYCWQCHRLMNRVGYPFEMYDHYGRFRVTERVLDPAATAENVDGKGKPRGKVYREAPADSSGAIELVGDPSLEGNVTGAVEYVRKLANSPRVEQVFVRHAFRYWMGRNETVGDAASLQAMHRAYRDSDGSMKALVTAMLSSDSFLMRVRASPRAAADPPEKSPPTEKPVVSPPSRTK